eukprot:TRINITY_DN7848_c0_g1_i1.p1 TRINITY_DN7848_c0_g1~~TRINITY_DN7848_c0_g1_i1.p1  ORF type:complete len:178 (+),score=22.71 TRINITY_DN7848_c0_g1_i1:53-586(+)
MDAPYKDIDEEVTMMERGTLLVSKEYKLFTLAMCVFVVLYTWISWGVGHGGAVQMVDGLLVCVYVFEVAVKKWMLGGRHQALDDLFCAVCALLWSLEAMSTHYSFPRHALVLLLTVRYSLTSLQQCLNDEQEVDISNNSTTAASTFASPMSTRSQTYGSFFNIVKPPGAPGAHTSAA